MNDATVFGRSAGTDGARDRGRRLAAGDRDPGLRSARAAWSSCWSAGSAKALSSPNRLAFERSTRSSAARPADARHALLLAG